MKKNVILWFGLIVFLSACVYCSLPEKPKDLPVEADSVDAAALEFDEIIEAYFKNRPVRDVPQTADFSAYLTGTFAKSNKDFGKLATSYENVLKSDAQNTDIKSSLYLYFVLSGQVEKAITYAYQALDVKPDEALPQLTILTGLIKKGEYQEALDLTQKIKSAYSSFMVPLLKSWIYAAQQNAPAALNELESIKGQAGLSSAYLLHRGMILDYFNRPLEAAEMYNELLKSAESKNVRVLLLMKDFEQRTHALSDKKAFVLNYSTLEDESFISKEMMSRSKDDMRVKTPEQGISWVLFDIGNALGQLSSLDLSLYFSNLALYLNPNSSVIRLFTGEVLEQLDMLPQANALYAKVTVEQNIYLSAQMRMILNLIHAGENKKAQSALLDLIKKYPDIPLFYMTLADVYRENEDYLLALQNYQKSLDLVKRRDKQVAPIYFYQGVCYEAMGNLDKALPLFEKAMALDTENPIYLNYVGYTWLEQNKKLPEALAIIQKAAAYAPDDGNILDSLGRAYFMLKDYKNALLYSEKAATLEAGNAVINSHLGDVYWQLRRYREAKFQWSHAATLKQSSSEKLLAELADKMKNGLKE